MSLETIQPNMFENQMIQRNVIRPLTGGSLLNKPTFGEKFLLGLKKFGAIFGRIGASVLRFFPGLGTVASSALYGVSNLAEMSYQNQVNKRFQELAIDEATAQANFNFVTPGFGMFGRPGGMGTSNVQDGLGMEKLGTVLYRETAAREAINLAHAA